ncbi:MAG: class I SAM-dependent methyltransferase [Pseudobdellovibrionaceae bacterium]|uniref:class I SAM-dependent methyltransferase n=1 Tax=Oligoflexus sp. TaxID=1971216 RepID=UPI0027C6773A|nr:class I SAM-dependent methyltransferase [Oligoflexus sp.]MDQ3234255.1 class I SAM-dependent methyltransferase [Pseudobdellovibrionaceae bacterium]HYX33007.1 class I SAM-dependent methyltransferase [Oligoflexus sp.]
MAFDKYLYYERSVQSPDVDAAFLDRVYREIRGQEAKVLGEDFCAAFALCCEWAKLNPEKISYGIDLDPEPLEYGRSHYLNKLTPEEQKRVHTLQTDVMNPELPRADIIAPLNFSFFGFKQRTELKRYFQAAYNRLNDQGLLIMDCFGGQACMEPNEHETEYDDFSYYWDQDTFDPLTNEAMFYIHYRPKGQKKIKNVFTYDWRLWSLPELRELLEEIGFKKVHYYWEGTDDEGEGDGNFNKIEKGEICDSWVAYIVGEK